MKKLAKPTSNSLDVYALCISKIRSIELKRNLENISQLIVEAAEEYDSLGRLADIYLTPQSLDINDDITKKVMENIYTQRMAKLKSPGRAIYNTLRLSAKFNQCPLCGHRQVKTLDHYLPKSNYSKHVVIPFNLIPSCSDCNKEKLDIIPSHKENQTLHPYYDDVTEHQWLFAEVIEDNPMSVCFYTQDVAEYDNVLNRRIKLHFKTFGLNDLYISQSGVLLSNLIIRITDLYNDGGAESVVEYLSLEAGSRRGNCINSWETAIYSALAESEWFCNGGFRE